MPVQQPDVQRQAAGAERPVDQHLLPRRHPPATAAQQRRHRLQTLLPVQGRQRDERQGHAPRRPGRGGEDDLDVGGEGSREAAHQLVPEGFLQVIQAVQDETQRLFGRRPQGQEGGETTSQLREAEVTLVDAAATQTRCIVGRLKIRMRIIRPAVVVKDGVALRGAERAGFVSAVDSTTETQQQLMNGEGRRPSAKVRDDHWVAVWQPRVNLWRDASRLLDM